ncbi:MAG: hypothetical protein COY42_32260 [Armatimonadetes bacterium CG_4_10_14_0_8_um_filter_66_14]|nr:MAG: hypothetical protein COS65_18775 [Armatimonadetes bacterium CG06_land_8_20_14_3_00_66_21]PIZ31678.1 MAG: hypothetical protein COY42_32260 [Armatimonadetes bacterium CG_4_10_14_0_8_um_filter_66_14]
MNFSLASHIAAALAGVLRRSTSRPMRYLVLPLLTAAATVGVKRPAMSAPSLRAQVEADWQRQEDARLAQIREPGTVRFVETTLQWPGAKPDDRARVPEAATPKVDGALDDPSWEKALVVPAKEKDQPAFRLCHDGERLYVAATLPAAAESRYGGEPTALDAAGAVDGVKDGAYGFHTWVDANPWWQVDLGKPTAISRVVVYNRLDYAPGLHNADNLRLLTSDDERSWTLRYDNQGKHFGGVGSGKPLDVALTPENGEREVRGRFVRIQVPSAGPLFLHLDEVEVYGPDDPARNLALHRPAKQISLSIWSKGGQRGTMLFMLGDARFALAGDPATGVALRGAPLAPTRARLRRANGVTTVEVALPFRGEGAESGRQFVPPAGDPLPLAIAADWEVTWQALAPLGFGKNRLQVDVKAPGALDPPLDLTVETVCFTPFRPETRTVLHRRLSQAAALPLKCEIDQEGALALVVSAGQGETTYRDCRTVWVPPVRETLDRAARLAGEFDRHLPSAFGELRARAARLAARERDNGPDQPARAALYHGARWLARQVAFSNPLLQFGRLLFVKRFTQEAYPDVCLNHMPWVSRPGGDLCVLQSAKPGESLFAALGRPTTDLADLSLRPILNGALGPGHVHGMDLWWDGSRVVFGYAKAKTNEPPAGWLDRRESYRLRREEEPTHLFESNVDGTGLRQLTHGEWSDLDPTYLPSGDIAFVSERCGCSLQCNEYDKDETSCNLYVMRPDGTNIRRLSGTKDGDYLPHTLGDGTIGYTRWEYQERSFAHIQSLWTVRPDGTGADALFKQHLNNPWAVEEARSIPDSPKLVAIATGHHTLPAGPVVLLDPRAGMNDPSAIRIVTPGVNPPEGGMEGSPVASGGVPAPGGLYQQPWPLSDKSFLVSYGYGAETDATGYALYLIDVYGTRELVYRDPAISCFSPTPLQPRPRPPVLPDATDSSKRDATCVVNDVGFGVDGVDPKSIRYLRVAQRLPWPYDNVHGGQRYEPDAKATGLNWTPVRVLGEVPVEADGSASFYVPVDTAVYFQLLDENHQELRRMRSFLSFQPGERRSCTGCHETREITTPQGTTTLAGAREPSVPVPPPWGDRPLSFLRDVQPVLDRHCAHCHSGLQPAGGVDLGGGLTEQHNRAYDTSVGKQLVAVANKLDDAKVTPPLAAFGSRKSRLIQVLREGPHLDRVHLRNDDWLRLVTWVDANAPYHDGFLNKRLPASPYDLAADTSLKQKLAAVHAQRCASCHDPAAVTRLDWIDLQQPRRSLFLQAPLAKKAGGSGKCDDVYKDETDADYQSLLRLVSAAVDRAWENPRRDLKAFTVTRTAVR